MDLDFISKDVREYMQQNGLIFSDQEKATLIHYSYLPFSKRTELLKKLAEETEDEALKGRILENLTLDQVWLDAFRNNTEGYVYEVVMWDEEKNAFTFGRFATAEMAHTHAVKQGREFRIRKYPIVGSRGQKPRRLKGTFDPLFNVLTLSDMEDFDIEEDSFEHPVANEDYNKDGILSSFRSSEWSPEIERSAEKMTKRANDRESYERANIPVPNPFGPGDIVKIVDDERHGIVGTSQQEWQKLLEHNEHDYIDVYTLEDNGSIRKNHFSPAELEYYEPEKEDDCDLLLAGQAILRGKGDLQKFADCYDRYKGLKRGWTIYGA